MYTIVKTTSGGDARLSVVGMAGWPAGDTDGLAGDNGRGLHTLRCQPTRSRRWAVQVHVFTLGLGGRGDGYHCGLNWGHSSVTLKANTDTVFPASDILPYHLRRRPHPRRRSPVLLRRLLLSMALSFQHLPLHPRHFQVPSFPRQPNSTCNNLTDDGKATAK